MEQHDKIINTVAKNKLSPEGLFRKGNSRTWLEDNNYYMTMVEFQPSGYSKGSFLNVGVSFLWEQTEDLNTTLSFNYGYRVEPSGKKFAPYSGDDESFQKEIEIFADAVLEKVIEYRQFRDLDYAKAKLSDNNDKDKLWASYDLAMLCFLKGDFSDGTKNFDYCLKHLKNSIYENNVLIKWREEFYNYCKDQLVPRCTSSESAQKMVCEMIQRRRDFFSSKSSYKKMKREFVWEIK